MVLNHLSLIVVCSGVDLARSSLARNKNVRPGGILGFAVLLIVGRLKTTLKYNAVSKCLLFLYVNVDIFC